MPRDFAPRCGAGAGLARLSSRVLRRAVEVTEKFAEHGEVIAARLGFAADRAQHVVQGPSITSFLRMFVEARQFAHEIVEAPPRRQARATRE